MVTTATSKQTDQQAKKKKFKVKNLFKKNKYKEFHNKPEENDARDSGRSIEVIDPQDETCPDSGQTHGCLLDRDRQTGSSTRPTKRVHFWRYSKDEALIEDDEVDELTHRGVHSEGGKRKKSKKQKTKQAGLRAWKYCRTGLKYVRTGLIFYSEAIASMNFGNLGGAFSGHEQKQPTDYTQYDKYDRDGFKKRSQAKADYTHYDSYRKTNKY